jgi:hypothetical protein
MKRWRKKSSNTFENWSNQGSFNEQFKTLLAPGRNSKNILLNLCVLGGFARKLFSDHLVRQSVSRKVATGMVRVGFTTKITEITKGGKEELAAESLRAWRLCARARMLIGGSVGVSRKGAKSPRGWARRV